ncbi:hypothetical protein APASM_6504 [Actinosynnema pretiosum subsp. pretiosum]|nr:hypothetical protein APASM_6504 [Actinosynnema pretiosum subsp. pretiosum]
MAHVSHDSAHTAQGSQIRAVPRTCRFTPFSQVTRLFGVDQSWRAAPGRDRLPLLR